VTRFCIGCTEPVLITFSQNTATASYRLLPEIIIREPIVGRAACEKFRACFPAGVVEIVEGGDKDAGPTARIASARYDTVSRECLRHDEFKDKVLLARKRDHFIFKVESVGAMAPDEIFLQSVKFLLGKAALLKEALASAQSTVIH
jgi:DNA-directed RNA polymerase I and III subunit RPAC1